MSGALQFPFSVHTALHGYDWSCIPPGMSRDELDDFYRRAIACRPESLDPGETFNGTVTRGARLAAFVIRTARGWDANGRDAEYAAFAFLPAVLAPKVDFDRLFADEAFCTPSRTPPSAVRMTLRP